MTALIALSFLVLVGPLTVLFGVDSRIDENARERD